GVAGEPGFIDPGPSLRATHAERESGLRARRGAHDVAVRRPVATSRPFRLGDAPRRRPRSSCRFLPTDPTAPPLTRRLAGFPRRCSNRQHDTSPRSRLTVTPPCGPAPRRRTPAGPRSGGPCVSRRDRGALARTPVALRPG